MISSVIVPNDSELIKLYRQECMGAFPKLDTIFKEDETSIALMKNGLIVGGAILENFDDISKDGVLRKYWTIYTNMKAVKLKRLWLTGPQKRAAIFKLFESIYNILSTDAYIYGVLSLPLACARKNQLLIKSNYEFLKPKTSLAQCNWLEDSECSSEGRKLLNTYLMFGAHFLGDMSGCEDDRSVRVVIGIELKQFNFQTISEYYA